MSKPHIKKERDDIVPTWICSGDGVQGVGHTPGHAYDVWKRMNGLLSSLKNDIWKWSSAPRTPMFFNDHRLRWDT